MIQFFYSFQASAFSLGDLCVPPMANVLKVFLENGQTKSFKYDAWTTVQDVVSSLESKLCLQASEHFSLVVEHIKSLKRNKLTLLDPQDTLARVSISIIYFNLTRYKTQCFVGLNTWSPLGPRYKYLLGVNILIEIILLYFVAVLLDICQCSLIIMYA